MKFVLVNHRTPVDASSCIECSRPLGRGYLRDVSTQRQYCDHDCYLQYEAKSLFMPSLMFAPWLAATRRDRRPPTPSPTPLEMMTSFAAASCWCSIVFAKTALRVSELMAEQAFDI
jgi:hypothetical protein